MLIIQEFKAAPHASYAGNATVVLPNSSGTLLLTDGSGASLTNLNGSNIASGTIAAARVADSNQDTSGTFDTADCTSMQELLVDVSFDATALQPPRRKSGRNSSSQH